MKEGWTNLLSSAFFEPLVAEEYRRALKQSGYRYLPPKIIEARSCNDGYTTLVLISLGMGWVYGYGIAVKGAKDRWSETDGIAIATRRALDNALVILKQKEGHDEKDERPAGMAPKDIKDWLYRLGVDSFHYEAAVDHRGTRE